jgi:LytS/YehU family sensor histidine kinase
MTRNKLYWPIQLSSWAIYITYIIIELIYYKLETSLALFLGLSNFIILVSSTHFYRWFINRNNINTLNFTQFCLYPIVGNLIISAILELVNVGLFNTHLPYSDTTNVDTYSYLFHYTETYRFTILWFICFHGIKFAKRAKREERAKIEAEIHLKEIELISLRSQLNPHFLFNSLNSIQALTLSDPKVARDATLKLSDLLRVSLSYNELKDISFQEELNLVINYLDLEKIRFDSRLNYKIEVSKNILLARIPPMSLQLLAENAVKHGIGKLKTGGEIVVFASKKGSILTFGIKNTGVLASNHVGKISRKGIGLENLNKRLVINYGITNGLSISAQDNIVTAQVSIPLKLQ